MSSFNSLVWVFSSIVSGFVNKSWLIERELKGK
jgi:hypothetical protein